ncbi:MAG TPA: IPT/TIG domain-containing protein [Solirubrobacterales bacterium]|nr:IPT/TIG domain-containing protein [Solirubrobacterales bacterium]
MKHRRRINLGVAAVMSAIALFAASAAQARTLTVGSVLPPGAAGKPFEGVQTLFNTALPEKGANLVSPVNGAIVRWQAQELKGGPFQLRVLRPNGSGAYTAVGTSGAVTPSGPGLQTFTANIPVKAGDLIGIDPTSATDEIGVVSEVPGASVGFIFPTPFEGATVPASGTKSGQEIALRAEVQPAPSITSTSPSSASIAGGAKVKITGTDFNGASEVKFGEVPAASFTVVSETEITAVVPRSKKAGRVDISVTTLAGTTASAGRFTYTACVVPNLKKNKLKAAKTRLRNAGCKLGKVKKLDGATGKNGKVTKQSPKPKMVKAPGAKVNVTLEK